MLRQETGNTKANLEAQKMLRQTRLLFGVLMSCLSASVPFLAAQAQDATAGQAYAQINQVQQALSSGLINSAQANDLISRANDILAKYQQWSIQDGGNLNVPDRLDLQGKIKRNSKRLANDVKENGSVTTAGGILPGLIGSTYNTLPYGATAQNTTPWLTSVATPYGPGVNTNPYTNYLTAPTAYGRSSYYTANPYASRCSGFVQGLLNRWGTY